MLNSTLLAFDEFRQAVYAELTGYPWPNHLKLTITSRTKTQDTLLAKLRRSPGIGLAAIHDIAGLRVVVDGGLIEQDEVGSAITAGTGPRRVLASTEVVDRRVQPSEGYRAVHIIGKSIDGLFVEIQVRTKLQDDWANMYERMGDRWSRTIRYEPVAAEVLAEYMNVPANEVTYAHVVAMAQSASLDHIAEIEKAEREYRSTDQRMRTPEGQAELGLQNLALGSRAGTRKLIRSGQDTNRWNQELRESAVRLIASLSSASTHSRCPNLTSR